MTESMNEREPTVADRPIGLTLIVLYKALWGGIEILAGLLVFFSYRLVAGELLEDSQDLLANWLLSHIHISSAGATRIGSLIVLLGILNLAFAVGIWRRSRLIQEVAMTFFILIFFFGLYRLAVDFRVLKAVAVALDGLIVYYLRKSLPKYSPVAGR